MWSKTLPKHQPSDKSLAILSLGHACYRHPTRNSRWISFRWEIPFRGAFYKPPPPFAHEWRDLLRFADRSASRWPQTPSCSRFPATSDGLWRRSSSSRPSLSPAWSSTTQLIRPVLFLCPPEIRRRVAILSAQSPSSCRARQTTRWVFDLKPSLLLLRVLQFQRTLASEALEFWDSSSSNLSLVLLCSLFAHLFLQENPCRVILQVWRILARVLSYFRSGSSISDCYGRIYTDELNDRLKSAPHKQDFKCQTQ